jgi:hypothetical protein
MINEASLVFLGIGVGLFSYGFIGLVVGFVIRRRRSPADKNVRKDERERCARYFECSPPPRTWTVENIAAALRALDRE